MAARFLYHKAIKNIQTTIQLQEAIIMFNFIFDNRVRVLFGPGQL